MTTERKSPSIDVSGGWFVESIMRRDDDRYELVIMKGDPRDLWEEARRKYPIGG